MGDTTMLQTLLDGAEGLCGHWLAFLTLEDLKVLSSLSRGASFSTLRELVAERAEWRLPYPLQLRCVGGVPPTVQDTAFDPVQYEKAAYLSSMDERTKRNIRKVSVPRSAVLGYVATRLPGVTSVRTWQFKGDVAGINELSVIERRRVREQLRTIDLLDITGSPEWKELLLSQSLVTGVHKIAELTSLESLEISNCNTTRGGAGFEHIASLVQLKSLDIERSEWLANFTGLESFTQLSTLHIGSLKLESLEGLASVPTLTSLDISNVWLENATVP